MSKLTGSRKATQFTESVIREMTRLNQLHGGVNLSQGFPDFPAPAVVKDAACAAIRADVNQYAVTWGARTLREAIAALEAGSVVRAAFGDDVVDHYLNYARTEQESFDRVVTDWERSRLYERG